MRDKPDVIFDVVFESGLLFFTIGNIGAAPACDITVTFNREIMGINGSKSIGEMPLFRLIRFMPPGKEIITFIDTSASYFRHGQPVEFEVSIAFTDRRGKRFNNTIQHDISIYRNIGYIDSEANST